MKEKNNVLIIIFIVVIIFLFFSFLTWENYQQLKQEELIEKQYQTCLK